MLQSAVTPRQDEAISSSRIGTNEIGQMVNDLFSGMLEIPVVPASETLRSATPPELQASISISGEWEADCYVLVSDKLASLIAAGMFDTTPGELNSDEVLDALGEVANVIGGNAKGMVDLDCTLSLPRVGRDISNLPDEAISVTFDCGGLPLTIVIVEL